MAASLLQGLDQVRLALIEAAASLEGRKKI
jgi:hypothetical protein